jgi:hypothetical protein
LQPCRIAVNSSGTAPTSCSDSTNTGNVLDLTYDFQFGTADNGNVKKITDNRPSMTGRSINFIYDPLNRIKSAYTDATSGSYCWGEKFTVDTWGNLTQIGDVTTPDPDHTGTGCTRENLSISVNTNNQINLSGYTYDSAANLTATPNPGGLSMSYNAENELTSVAGVTYTYDGDGKRVKKSSGTLYWYGVGADPLLETDGSGGLVNEYIFFGGKRIARRDSSSNIVYYFADQLGSARVVTNASGTILDDSDFYPYGGERPVTGPSSGIRYKFTGKERDDLGGGVTLDNFGAGTCPRSTAGLFRRIRLGVNLQIRSH